MPHFPSSLRFQRSGHWLRLGRHRVWLETSPLTDQLLARDESERQQERARHFHTLPSSRP
ncbi:hypothetical protein [Streptacidiphilus sp. P02-A3a]|uniref:hypothetical protein n=1 Tax=Streptacidiphilus sp. P02-A3a TaxID=2704468 RepID=UPI0015FCDE0E|nr:hypothetical protein [Streptacidiphilus sp. P02-A3a]QMU67317.1 hypothetical protein GXP74_02930 [Streptacidiphilus sp. P02-A3a]QMU74824.1 hypothetical protein GXW83_02580 [Streptacidiphilus sp. PB12-B1b]